LPPVKGSLDLSMLLIIAAFITFMSEIILRKFKPPIKAISNKIEVISSNVADSLKKNNDEDHSAAAHVKELLKNKK